jgi:hypothetical protein
MKAKPPGAADATRSHALPFPPRALSSLKELEVMEVVQNPLGKH